MKTLTLSEHWQLQWAAVGRGLESVSGDLELVVPRRDGALIALMDGLGHGPDAAAASQAAAQFLAEHSDLPLHSLLQGCHEALRSTRGVALSAVAFSALDSSVTWTGIGNVEAVLFGGPGHSRARALVPRGGVVGYQLPSIHTATVPTVGGELLVMVTDGIHTDFEVSVDVLADVEDVARELFEQHCRRTDDALVLTVRFVREAA